MPGRIPREKNLCLKPVCFRKYWGRCNDILPLHPRHFHRNLQNQDASPLIGGGRLLIYAGREPAQRVEVISKESSVLEA